MATVNQLVRGARTDVSTKTRRLHYSSAHNDAAYVYVYTPQRLKSLTQRYAKYVVCD
jgi:hypothetical protein